MMESNQKFFIDVLNILPDDIECYIQAPDLESDDLSKLLSPSEYSYYQYLYLDKNMKETFIQIIKNEYVLDFFQSMEIRKGKRLIFEGYDGIDSRLLSKTIDLPEWFKEKYKLDWDYMISKEW